MKLKPGAPEAVAEGCTCDPRTNQHGRGWMGEPNMYYTDSKCPLHGAKIEAWGAEIKEDR